MSLNVENAFNSALKLNRRSMTLRNQAGVEKVLFVTISNYSRSLQLDSELTIEGREFIIPSSELGSQTPPKIGDRLTDSELGVMSITESKALVVFGKIIGYRIRTS